MTINKIIGNKEIGIKMPLVIVLALFLTACGGGGGSSDNDSSSTDEADNSSTDTSEPTDDSTVTPVTPSNTEGSNSETDVESQFFTTRNSQDDFTIWGCELEFSGQDYVITLDLLESKAGRMLWFDSEGTVIESIEGAEWAADSQDMLIANVEEEKALRFSDYFFFDDVSWDATIRINDQDTDVECQLYDQDLNAV